MEKMAFQKIELREVGEFKFEWNYHPIKMKRWFATTSQTQKFEAFYKNERLTM